MKKINKLLVAVIMGHLFSAYAATPDQDREEGVSTLTPGSHWFGVNGDGRLINVSNQARAYLPERDRNALVTVQRRGGTTVLDLSKLPAKSMRGLWNREDFWPIWRKASTEVKDFFNDSDREITLLVPKTLERIEYILPRDCPYWGCTIVTVDLNGCSALKTINSRAFVNCSSLTNINFPACLEEIHEDAFVDCTNLKKLILPPAPKAFSENALFRCANLRYLTLGKLSASASP
ncbi:MAG: leucine-rich repeat domain-containing protein, partial [Holosporales bacterium]|nr:leucine-rich repeat domain-containing protein [Holosporales bacterium]